MLEQVSWQDFWPLAGPMLEQSVLERLLSHGDTICEKLQPIRSNPPW